MSSSNSSAPSAPTVPSVIVGVDGSPSAEYALDWAVDEAALRGAELRVVHAWPGEPPRLPLPDRADTEARGRVAASELLAAYADRAQARRPELKVTSELIAGAPVAGLMELAEGAGLLVVGSRGMNRFSSLVLGSVSHALAAHSPCPVVVTGSAHGGTSEALGGPVILGVAPDEGAEPIGFAFAEAARRGAGLEAVRAWMAPQAYPGYMVVEPGDEARRNRVEGEQVESLLAAARKAAPDVPVATDVFLAEPEAALVAATEHAALLVVGARRSRGRFPLPLGAVTSRVLQHAHCPVAVVPVR